MSIAAVYADVGDVVDHGPNIQYFDLKVFKDPVTGAYSINGFDQGQKSKLRATLAHGWLLWIAWGLFGFLQVVSNRYLK